MRVISAIALALAFSASASSTAPAQKPIDTLIVRPDSGSTAPKAVADTSGRDTIKKALDARDTVAKTGGLPSAAMVEDTSYHFWRHPYWGIGAGWGLGSFPLFSEWQNGLPDSSAKLAGPGSVVPQFKVVEPVNLYNIFWPIYISFTPFITERQALSFEGAAYFIFSGKSFKASLTTGQDSVPSSVAWTQSCAATFFSIGMDYRRTIPEEYFKVENVQRTTANIGFSVVPLMRFSKSSSYSFTPPLPDSTLNALNRNIDNRTFTGIGGSWKIGISSLRKLSPKSGIEIGISYIGRYLGYFRNGKTRILWKDLNPGFGRPNEKISFLSHTFEISLILQTGRAGKAIQPSHGN
jgi:hypothetical protein